MHNSIIRRHPHTHTHAQQPPQPQSVVVCTKAIESTPARPRPVSHVQSYALQSIGAASAAAGRCMRMARAPASRASTPMSRSSTWTAPAKRGARCAAAWTPHWRWPPPRTGTTSCRRRERFAAAAGRCRRPTHGDWGRA